MSRADGPWTPRFGLAARVISSRWFRRYFGGDLPERDIRWGGVRSGMDVYELGAGAGLYTLPLARSLGESGRLAAGEYWPAGAALLSGRVRKAGLDNVVVHVGDGNALPARRARSMRSVAFTQSRRFPDAKTSRCSLERRCAQAG